MQNGKRRLVAWFLMVHCLAVGAALLVCLKIEEALNQ